MQLSTFRDSVSRQLTGFAWDQWAQLGIFASAERQDRWAADPEALLLFTLEAGRDDARLFEEVLDWLLTNERLVSVQRLKNLCADDEDRRLAEAALAWLAQHRPRTRFVPARPRRRPRHPSTLFRTLSRPVQNPDEAFLSFGFLKPATEPSGKSGSPPLERPVSFAFRMRQLFGVGSRSEVVRYLLTVSSPDVPAQDVAQAVAYAKRNVNETLSALVASRVVTTFLVGNERRYQLNRDLWGQLLGLSSEAWPTYRDWPRLFLLVRRFVRWLSDDRLEELSPYLLASQARALADELKPSFAFAGVSFPGAASAPGEAFWPVFVAGIEQVVSTVTTDEGHTLPVLPASASGAARGARARRA
jgi:hypothetical protein